jgi:hypothetical protein
MRTATILTSFLLVAFLGSCGDGAGDNVRTGTDTDGQQATDVAAANAGDEAAGPVTGRAIDDGSVPTSDPETAAEPVGRDTSNPADEERVDEQPAGEPKVEAMPTDQVDQSDLTEQEQDEGAGAAPAIPAGASPEDIRAIRGAQQMLQAEEKLRKMISDGNVEGVDKLLTFEEISSWAYKNGLEGMPPEVKDLDGKTVMMVGFMLPIHKIEDMEEFLLVQSLWACCYGQPPDLNGLVRVVMTNDNKVDYEIDPVRMIGKFKIEAYEEDGFIVDIYQLHTDKIEVLR